MRGCVRCEAPRSTGRPSNQARSSPGTGAARSPGRGRRRWPSAARPRPKAKSAGRCRAARSHSNSVGRRRPADAHAGLRLVQAEVAGGLAQVQRAPAAVAPALPPARTLAPQVAGQRRARGCLRTRPASRQGAPALRRTLALTLREAPRRARRGPPARLRAGRRPPRRGRYSAQRTTCASISQAGSASSSAPHSTRCAKANPARPGSCRPARRTGYEGRRRRRAGGSGCARQRASAPRAPRQRAPSCTAPPT
jgi:hypothetical protein